jgi:hypothetical protein
MKCRKCVNISDNIDKTDNQLVWFGKTGKILTSGFYVKKAGESAYSHVSDSSISIADSTITISGITYPFSFSDNGGTVNGVYKNADGTVAGYFSRVQSAEITDDQPNKNYDSGTDAVIDSLIQRLSVIKGELWYQVNYGLPLTEKYKSKGVFDSVISNIISSDPGVRNLLSFSSSVDKSIYNFTCSVLSIYGDTFTVGNSYSI